MHSLSGRVLAALLVVVVACALSCPPLAWSGALQAPGGNPGLVPPSKKGAPQHERGSASTPPPKE